MCLSISVFRGLTLCSLLVNIAANLLVPNFPPSVEGNNYIPYLQMHIPKILWLVFMNTQNIFQILHIFLHVWLGFFFRVWGFFYIKIDFPHKSHLASQISDEKGGLCYALNRELKINLLKLVLDIIWIGSKPQSVLESLVLTLKG